MKNFNLFFIFLLTVLVVSCDKNDNAELNLQACKLTKETFVSNDGQSVTKYSYNDSGQMIKITEEDADYSLTINISYDENGRINELTGNDNGDEFKGTCTWDNNTWTIVFMMKEGNTWVETEWKPVVKLNDSNQVIEYLDYEKNSLGKFELFSKTVYTWADGNITKEEYTGFYNKKNALKRIFKRKQKQNALNTTYTTTYTYDDKNNANASIGLMNIIWNEMPITKNNVVKEEISGSYSTTNNYTYQYNDTNYPVQVSGDKMEKGNFVSFEYDCN